MLPVNIPLTFINQSSNSPEILISWQIPTIILLTLIFSRKVIFSAFTFYIILGLFIFPIFHHGGSIGYLLTPNFGYLLGSYPLIMIIDKLNSNNKLNVRNYLKYSLLAIISLHLTGILYNFIQIIFYKEFNIFLYNLGKYSIGKIGYHLMMLFPLILLINPIKYFKKK